MKLERLHESLLTSIVLVGGLSIAVAMGSMAGRGSMGMVGMFILGTFLVGAFLFLRERVWMLIPAAWMLGGRVELLPFPFSVAHIVILYAFAGFLLLKAFKVIRLRPKWGIVELWMLVSLIYLATVFVRNPVGFEALGSERVGGRPYFNVVIACAAFWVLSRAVATSRDAFFVPLLTVAGHLGHTLINVIAFRFPSTVGPLTQLYSGLAAAEDQSVAQAIPGESPGRLVYWQGTSTATFLAACSYWRPFTLVNPLYFGRLLVLAFALFAVFQSGFRSALFAMALYFLASSYFRRGWVEVGKGLLLGVGALSLLLAMQGRVFDLPFGAQRALSFLPGKWDHAAVSDARGSTEWRVTMWKAMLGGDRYISNKWLGDGFGFTRRQLQIMHANQVTGSTADQQENLLISGGVHSGPITAVRYVGYVGLLLFLILLGLVAHRAVKLIRRSEGTPFYPMALFIGIPLVLYPLIFVLIFGAYETDLPIIIIGIGMLKMLENSLDAHEAKPKETILPVQSSARLRRPAVAPAGLVR